ncbi:MAG: DUF1819 family protein [Anaerolineae bacterium]|nr:DUF1819 family protein [Anaerolineae bacterium]
MSANRQYNSTMAGKGAFLSDVKIVLREIGTGQSQGHIRQAVIEGNLLDHETIYSRTTVWGEIFRRYISGRDPKHVATLSRMVAGCASSAAVDLVLLCEYCQIDALMYDLTADCTYGLYQNARTVIDKTDVSEWLIRQESRHPEIAEWSPQTRGRLIRGYLSAIRDFGLVTGVKQKEFHKLYVPREAFVYALYHQKDRGIEGKALIYSTDWRLFLLSEREVVFLLEDAASGGFVSFRRAGDIYDLQFLYRDLHEVVYAITDRQVLRA